MAQKRDTRAYKMVDRRGRTNKYGVTNDLKRREAENRRAGKGERIKPMSGPRTRASAEARETDLIDKYTRSKGRKPPGNKTR